MAQGRIVLTSVGAPTKQGKYSFIPIEYSSNGKDFKKKVMDFADKDVYNAFAHAQVGEAYDTVVEKDENGYWQMKSVTKAEGPVAEAVQSAGRRGTVAAATTRSTYETPEERARRQILIVRQSSIAQAVAMGTVGASVEDVLARAGEFEDWVNRE